MSITHTAPPLLFCLITGYWWEHKQTLAVGPCAWGGMLIITGLCFVTAEVAITQGEEFE